MIDRILRCTGHGLLCVLLPFTHVKTEAASIIKETRDVAKPDSDFVYTETGWDRIKFMCKSTDYQFVPQEIANTMSATTAASFFGGAIGGFIWSKNEYIKFMKTNFGTEYPSHLEAKSAMTNRMTYGMYNGFKAWCWRFTLITLVFNVILRTASAYRGERTVYECLGTGSVCGALGGWMFRDKELLFNGKNAAKLNSTKGVLKGIGVGLAVGAGIAIIDLVSDQDKTKNISTARYWQHYFEHQRRNKQQAEASNPVTSKVN